MVHDAFNPILKVDYIEIDQQSELFAAQTEVRKQLSVVYWQYRFDRLYFENHCLVYQNIETIPGVEFHVLVHHRQRHLAVHSEAICRNS